MGKALFCLGGEVVGLIGEEDCRVGAEKGEKNPTWYEFQYTNRNGNVTLFTEWKKMGMNEAEKGGL